MLTLKDIEKTDWYKTRPRTIQLLVHRFPPVCSVRIRETRQMGYVYSWSENNTVTLIIDPAAEENKSIYCAMDVIYQVFGYGIDDLQFLRENPPSVAIELSRKMLEASKNTIICEICDQPKVPGYSCANHDFHYMAGSSKDACAYHSGLCCECAALKERNIT